MTAGSAKCESEAHTTKAQKRRHHGQVDLKINGEIGETVTFQGAHRLLLLLGTIYGHKSYTITAWTVRTRQRQQRRSCGRASRSSPCRGSESDRGDRSPTSTIQPS